jgi:hypothetical protein
MEDEWYNPRGEMPTLPGGVSLRLMVPDDYPTLQSWWTTHGWKPVAQRILPPALSVFAEVDGQPVAFACLYVDAGGTGIGMLEWIVADPAASPRRVHKAVSALVAHLVWRSGEEDLRCSMLVTACRQPGLVKLLTKLGYQDGGPVNHLSI